MVKICGLMKTTLLDYPGHVACTIFMGGCNLRCPFCHNAELLDAGLPAAYTEEEIMGFLNKRKRTLEGVAISGGEPTLQRDLPAFIKRIREETGLEIKLDTNGTNPDMLAALMEDGLLDYAAMDIKAGESGYARLCGVSAENLHFSAILKSRDLLLAGRIPYEFRTTVVDGLHTASDFEEIGPFIQGCERYYLQAFQDSDHVLCRAAGYGTPTREKLLQYAALLEPYVGSVQLRGVEE